MFQRMELNVMSNEMYKINSGDIVSVNFHNVQHTLIKRGRVVYPPLSAVDSWIIFDLDTQIVHYISEPCTISKKNNENEA